MFVPATPGKWALSLLLLLRYWIARNNIIVVGASTTTTTTTTTTTSSVPRKKPPPHILFVLVDDLGWGDVGFHSSRSSSSSNNNNNIKKEEIQTPTMDRLVQKEGLELNRHYVHSSCTGTRTSLQSGRFPVHVQTSLKNPEDPSSGMPRNLTGVAEYMKQAHYATHYVGKWDVGMASPKHTPKGRGYDTSLNYFEHKNDYWTQECAQSVCCRQHQQQKEQLLEGHEDRVQTQRDKVILDLWDTDRPARELAGTDYEEFIFQRRMLEIIDGHHHHNQQQQQQHNDQRHNHQQHNHNRSNFNSHSKNQNQTQQQQQPLFLFYAPHVAHCPLQVPQSYLDQFENMEDDQGHCAAQTPNILPVNQTQPKPQCRKQYHAMVKVLDDIIASLVDRLKAYDMWENTIMVLTSDNGGPTVIDESGATNFPLRGGKYSDWEGGVRATAFVSGGALPLHRRGKVVQHPFHICDWYATLPALAGIHVMEEDVELELDDDNEQQQQQPSAEEPSSSSSPVPPVDARNIWPLLMADENPDTASVMDHKSSSTRRGRRRRDEIPLSKHALIVGDYKLLWNENANISWAGWTQPNYPNANTIPKEIESQSLNCTVGCLFNVATDAGEHVDLAKQDPLRLQAMKERLQILRQGFYENDDRGLDSCPFRKEDDDDDDDLPCACWMAVNYYGGFFGPFQEVDNVSRIASTE